MSKYEVKKDKYGKMSIFLKEFDIDIAKFNCNASDDDINEIAELITTKNISKTICKSLGCRIKNSYYLMDL